MTLWDRFDHYQDPWLTNPYNPINNINYTESESGLPTFIDEPAFQIIQPFFLTVPSLDNNLVVLPYQQAFVNKVLSYTFARNNILYNPNNEHQFSLEGREWVEYWADYIKNEALLQGKEIYITSLYDGLTPIFDHVIPQPARFNFVESSKCSTYHTPGGEAQYDVAIDVINQTKANGLRPVTAVKVRAHNVLPEIGGQGTSQERVWRGILAGFAGTSQHRLAEAQPPPYTNGAPDLGFTDLGQKNIMAVRKFTDIITMWECEPHQELLMNRSLDEAYLVAKVGEQYGLYFPYNGSVGLDLTNESGVFNLNWINIRTGLFEGEETVYGGTIAEITVPGDAEDGWAATIVKTITPPDLVLISGLTVASGEQYVINYKALDVNEVMYIDRTQNWFTAVPPELAGETYIQTAYGDKFSSTSVINFVSFTIDKKAEISVLYTNLNTTLEEDWLNAGNGWIDAGITAESNLGGEEKVRRIRSKVFDAGATIELPGNGSTKNKSSMYNIVIKPFTPVGNQPPSVDAGADQTIILPTNSVNLNGTVTDDGKPNPPGTYTVAWTSVSGPGVVSFGNANAEDTTATFPQAGTYVLRLTADDSELSDFDDISILVAPEPGDDVTISGLTVASGEQYVVNYGAFDVNAPMYIDRGQNYFTVVPPELAGETYIQTAYGDKFSSTSVNNFVSFTIDLKAEVYVLYTNLNTTLETDWLNAGYGWIDSGFTVGSNFGGEESVRHVRSKVFDGGATIELPGNGSTKNKSSMYTIVVKKFE